MRGVGLGHASTMKDVHCVCMHLMMRCTLHELMKSFFLKPLGRYEQAIIIILYNCINIFCSYNVHSFTTNKHTVDSCEPYQTPQCHVAPIYENSPALNKRKIDNFFVELQNIQSRDQCNSSHRLSESSRVTHVGFLLWPEH